MSKGKEEHGRGADNRQDRDLVTEVSGLYQSAPKSRNATHETQSLRLKSGPKGCRFFPARTGRRGIEYVYRVTI